MIKKLSAFLCASAVMVGLALAQQGFKISQYPQIHVVPANYLFIVANPGVTNNSVAYSDLAAQMTADLSLIQATNNDELTSNQLYSVLYSTMVAYVNTATNPFTGGSFVLTLNGYGTNLNLFGTNVFALVQGDEFDITNAIFDLVTPSTVAVFDSIKRLTNLPNASGILTNDGSGNIGFSSTATTPIDTTTITVVNIYATTNFSTNFYSSVSYITNLYVSIAYITNLYVSQGFITNLYASTNFSTNLYFVSGKGNTLVITNVYVSEQGVLVNSNTAINSAVITDDKHAYTNAVNAHGVFTNSATGPPSFGLLQNTELQNSGITVQNVSVALGGSTLAQGSKPVFDLQSSTNLLLASISSPTNGVSTASSIDFTVPEAVTNIAGAVSQTSLANFNQTNINHAIRYYVNRTGSDQTITVGSWETDSGRTSATTYTCTNNTTLALMFSAYIGQFTNVTSYKTFR